jgi:hypothetical protein
MISFGNRQKRTALFVRPPPRLVLPRGAIEAALPPPRRLLIWFSGAICAYRLGGTYLPIMWS